MHRGDRSHLDRSAKRVRNRSVRKRRVRGGYRDCWWFVRVGGGDVVIGLPVGGPNRHHQDRVGVGVVEVVVRVGVVEEGLWLWLWLVAWVVRLSLLLMTMMRMVIVVLVSHPPPLPEAPQQLSLPHEHYLLRRFEHWFSFRLGPLVLFCWDGPAQGQIPSLIDSGPYPYSYQPSFPIHLL